MSKVLARLTPTLLADVKNARLLLSTGVQRMPVTVSTADGVTVLTLTSDPNSSCPPLCQIIKGLCYSPRCCTVSQQLKENQGTSQSTLGVSSLIFWMGCRRLTDFCKTRTGKPISYPGNPKSNIFIILSENTLRRLLGHFFHSVQCMAHWAAPCSLTHGLSHPGLLPGLFHCAHFQCIPQSRGWQYSLYSEFIPSLHPMCMGECVESVAGVTDVQKEVVIVGQLTAPTERALLALTDWQVLTQEGLYSKGAGLTKALEIPNTLLILQMILSWADRNAWPCGGATLQSKCLQWA